MGFIYFTILLLEVFFIVKMEKTQWGSLLTPLNVLALSFTIVTTFAIVYSYVLSGVTNYYLPSLIIWEVGLFVMFIPSCFFAQARNNYSLLNHYTATQKKDLYRFLFLLTCLMAIISLTKMRSLSVDYSLGSDDFGDNFGNNGLIGHINILFMVLFGYFVCKLGREHKYAFVLLILITIVLFSQAVKTRIMTPFLITIFALSLSGRLRISMKLLIMVAFLSYFFFFLTYFFLMYLTSDYSLGEFNDFIIGHFLDYLLGGTLSFSIDFQNNIVEPNMTDAFFSPFMIIINKFTEYPIDIEVANPIMIEMGDLGSTNVRTFFGTLYCYSHSILFLLVFTFFFSIYIYNTYSLYIKSKDIFLMLAASSDMCFLVFGGFFDMFWTHIYPYEIVVFCFFLSFISKHVFIAKTK